MKALLIGCGQMGLIHLKNLLKNDAITHVFIVDKDACVASTIAALTPSKDYSFHESLEDFLEGEEASDIGIALIVSNTTCHGAHLDALVTKFSTFAQPPLLFVEKPLLENVAELAPIEARLRAYPGDIIGGYLLRYSPISQVAAAFIKENSLSIASVSIQWLKKRAPTRPSPGVLVDEATHSLDLVLSYFLKMSGLDLTTDDIDIKSLSGERTNSIVDEKKQLALYGTLSPKVLADLRYQLSVKGVLIDGHSSFNACNDDGSANFKRAITLNCHFGYSICCQFDHNGEDILTVYKNGQVCESQQFKVNKAAEELNAVIARHLGKDDAATPHASLQDMIQDLYFVDLLQKKIEPMTRFMNKSEKTANFFQYRKSVECDSQQENLKRSIHGLHG